MALFDWLNSVISDIGQAVSNVIGWIGGLLSNLYNVLAAGLLYLWSMIRGIGAILARLIHLLVTMQWRELWAYLKALYDSARRWAQRIYAIVFGPIRQIQATILQIYNTYFRPIIQTIDALRRIVAIIAIFDRKLAAQLDQFLLKVEAWVLAPITYLLQRINAISSYLTAIVTTLGLLDRGLLIASIQRDVSIIWGRMTNPLGASNATGAPLVYPTVSVYDSAVKEYSATETGLLADGIAKGQGYLDDALTQIGVV